MVGTNRFSAYATGTPEKMIPVPKNRILFVAITISLALILPLELSTCSTLGIHNLEAMKNVDFGPPEEIRFCLLIDEGVTEDDAHRLMAEVSKEFSRYDLKVTVPWIHPWVRHDFFKQGIMEDVWSKSLEAPCDRLMALVGRNLGDALFGLLLIETLGVADTVTYTRGYAVAKRASLAQVFLGPKLTIIHESYHLLGCIHQPNLAKCYNHIRDLKRLKAINREHGEDFFPSVSPQGLAITTREQANAMVHRALERARHERSPEH